MRLLLSLFCLFMLWSCSEKEPQKYILQDNAFGTTYTIQYFSNTKFNAEKGIDSVIHAVNKSVSTYMPNSDISKINRGDSTLVVDNIFKEVFKVSEEIHQKSNGYFDPTIGVLRNAYGFGDVKPLEKIDDRVLDSLMQFVGFHKVAITSEGTIKKKLKEIYFDFNAVAKGYGIDCMGRYLEGQGVYNYVIELGGEVLAKGNNLTKEKPWISGIEDIESEVDNRSFSAKIVLKDAAMAGSGNYRKFIIDTLTGQKFVHTLNPLTGSAEKSDVTSATVVAPNCALADAYATTFMAMGLEKSKALLETLDNIEAYLTYTNAANETGVYMTPKFQDILVK